MDNDLSHFSTTSLYKRKRFDKVRLNSFCHILPCFRMFTSDQWKDNMFAKTTNGRLIEDVILDKKFWKNIFICLKAASPLIKVLQMVESKEKTTNHGVSLWAMDQVKGEIQEELNDVKVLIFMNLEGISLMEDGTTNFTGHCIWDNQLHKPLHVVAYYLNPEMHYGSNFKVDLEVKKGMIACIVVVFFSWLIQNWRTRGKLEDHLWS
ncbi:hypothetical protein HKD37_15G043169 [Glycine soja]